MFHSQLHHPGQIPISEAGVFVNSVVEKSSGQKHGKKNLPKMWQLRPTNKERIHLVHLIDSKQMSTKEGATYIQETYLLHPSSCFLLKLDASFFLFSFSENNLVSTRYHSSAYSTSISHLASFYSILSQSFSSLLSSNHTIFP